MKIHPKELPRDEKMLRAVKNCLKEYFVDDAESDEEKAFAARLMNNWNKLNENNASSAQRTGREKINS